MDAITQNRAGADTAEKPWLKSLIILLSASFFCNLSSNMYQSNFALYLTESGFKGSAVSTIISLFPFAVMIMSFFSGRLCQKISPKLLLLGAISAMLLTTLSYAMSPANMAIYVLTRIIHGASNGLTFVVFMTIIAQTIPDRMMTTGMGIQGVGTIIAQALAPSIGIFISEEFGFNVMFFVALIPMALAFAVSFMVGGTWKKEKNPDVSEKKSFSFSNYFEKSVLLVASINFLITCSSSTITWYLVSLAGEKGISGIGIYFMVNSVVLLFIRLFSGKMLDRAKIKHIVFFSCAMLLIGMLLIYTAQALWTMLLAAVFCGSALGISVPSLQAEAVRQIPMERRSVASSTYMVSSSMAFTVGSFVSGIVAGAFGYANTFLIMCIPIAGAVLITIFGRFKSRDPAPKEQTA